MVNESASGTQCYSAAEESWSFIPWGRTALCGKSRGPAQQHWSNVERHMIHDVYGRDRHCFECSIRFCPKPANVLQFLRFPIHHESVSFVTTPPFRTSSTHSIPAPRSFIALRSALTHQFEPVMTQVGLRDRLAPTPVRLNGS